MSERARGRWKAIAAALALGACDEVLGAEFEDPYVPPSDTEIIASICHEVGELGCENPPTQLECETSFNDQVTEADASGCRKELRSYLECANESEMSCVNSGDKPSQPAISQACEPLRDAFSACTTPQECSSGSTGGPNAPDAGQSCWVECADYAGECAESTPLLSCKCTLGPKQGTSFTAEDCLDIGNAVDASCR